MTADHDKQFTFYSNERGPNGWKVAIILEELGLTYQTKYLDIKEKKENVSPSFLKINPNGRIPALIDHNNNDFVVWESGAIILYLVGKYDKEHKISFANFDQNILASQYLIFQVSGQGPSFGQLTWFTFAHPENVPSAIERYKNESKRILKVLDGILESRDYLVGDKASYADLSFVVWNWVFDFIGEQGGMLDWKTQFPNVGKWQDRLETRKSITKIKADRAAAIAASTPA